MINKEEKGNVDYLMDVIDWEANADPDFSKNRFMAPKVIWENKSAKEGVTITNTSATEPIVMLKHFAENPELVIE